MLFSRSGKRPEEDILKEREWEILRGEFPLVEVSARLPEARDRQIRAKYKWLDNYTDATFFHKR